MPQGEKPSAKRLECMREVRVAALVVREGRLLVIRHRHPDPEKEYWVVPGGDLEPGESPAEGARREMEEETGLHVKVERLSYLLDQEYRKRRELSLYFFCTCDDGEPVASAELLKRKGDFVHELLWIRPEELVGKRFFPEALLPALLRDMAGVFPGEGVYLSSPEDVISTGVRQLD